MNKNFKLYFMLIGLIGLLASCQKDEVKVVMSDNPKHHRPSRPCPICPCNGRMGMDTLYSPEHRLIPALSFLRIITLKPVQAVLISQNQSSLFHQLRRTNLKITVGDLNTILIKKFPTDQTHQALIFAFVQCSL